MRKRDAKSCVIPDGIAASGRLERPRPIHSSNALRDDASFPDREAGPGYRAGAGNCQRNAPASVSTHSRCGSKKTSSWRGFATTGRRSVRPVLAAGGRIGVGGAHDHSRPCCHRRSFRTPDCRRAGCDARPGPASLDAAAGQQRDATHGPASCRAGASTRPDARADAAPRRASAAHRHPGTRAHPDPPAAPRAFADAGGGAERGAHACSGADARTGAGGRARARACARANCRSHGPAARHARARGGLA